ncbi:MAG: hypothetical protein V4792_16410 [Pseudomonadota bacterium]
MMTAELEAESGQATLDGVADVQAPAAAELGEAFRFVAAGPLLAPVLVHATGRGAVQMVALLQQVIPHHPQALPLLAVHTVPPDAGESFDTVHRRACALAAPLRTGEHVIVIGHGVEVGTHQHHAVLRVINCEAVRPFTPPAATAGAHLANAPC